MKDLRNGVFWPPFLLLMGCVGLSLADGEWFLSMATSVNSWILSHFGWLFSTGTLLMLATCVWVYFSALGNVRIGGKDAKPLLDRWKWFSITLCTTVATGILFWGTAEPLYHLHGPPKSLGLDPNSAEAARFSLSTMFLHWSFTPYAIYSVPALTFALVYYNKRYSFSLSSTLAPLLGKNISRWGGLIDAICLFTLVAGMAASLGAGVLTLLGAGKKFLSMESNSVSIGLVTLSIVGVFVASAATGLMKGIRILSDVNAKIFFGLCIFIFVVGPTGFILSFSVEAFGEYLGNFFQKSLFTGAASDDGWPKSWTIFYWANWLAWAPITALFLGKISYGYTVKQFLQINLLSPALFSCVWMSVFSGSTIYYDRATDGSIYKVLQSGGPESVVYSLIDQLPLAGLLTAVFVFASFLSYVTAADSNTDAMGGISTRGISPESPSPPVLIKVAWGVTVGAVAWVMVSFAGIDGVKMLSNLGGLPALFLVLLVMGSLVRLVLEEKAKRLER